MRVGTRFSIAVHLLTLLGSESGAHRPASEQLASSVGVNPVVVRSVMSQLRRAGLVCTSQGVAGAALAMPLDEIRLIDVYRAVEAEGGLFSIHERPNPKCPIGAGIQGALEVTFGDAQSAFEEHLAKTSLATILNRVQAARSDL